VENELFVVDNPGLRVDNLSPSVDRVGNHM